MNTAKLFTLQLFNEPKKLVAILVFLVSCILFIYQVADFFRAETKLEQKMPVVTGNASFDRITTNSPLFKSPLFGNYISNLSDAEIKQSSLDFQVVGILFSHEDEQSQVLIKVASGEEKTYLIGEKLPGGAKIKQINENGIVVLYNGALESLSLPKNELLFDKPAKPLIGE